jgi:hypothetical protein
VNRRARGRKQENRARATKAGQGEDGNRAEGKSKDRGEDRGGDEGSGEDVEVQSIYLSKMNK